MGGSCRDGYWSEGYWDEGYCDEGYCDEGYCAEGYWDEGMYVGFTLSSDLALYGKVNSKQSCSTTTSFVPKHLNNEEELVCVSRD